VKNNILQVKHNASQSGYQVVMPLDLGIRIDMDDSVRTLIEVTERMDYSELARTYQRQPRASEATLKQMLQIVLLGFMNGMYSTRKIESACRNDIRFMFILGMKRTPDHSRIADFIRRHLGNGVLERLLYQFVEQLADMGEVAFDNLFVDGTKEEANANRYSFVWAKSTSKNEARVEEKLTLLLERISIEYGVMPGEAEACREALSERKASEGIEFVHGHGKRKTQLQRDAEALERLLGRKAKYAGYKETFRGRNSFSKTDPDATFMRMKEDHMKNGQLKPGYNLQLGIEGEYIIGVHVSSERSDELALSGLLEHMDAGYGRRHKNIVADAGYESEENYARLRVRGQAAYIKPQNYEKSKTRTYRNNVYLHDNMPYDTDTDTYTCPAGNTFRRLYKTTRKSKSGYESAVTVYECSGCERCQQKALCTRAKGNRQIRVSKAFLSLRQESLERITTELGILLRMNRSIQSEGAFGVLKQDYAFRRFLRRGEGHVFTEVLIYAMAYNINKLHNKTIRNMHGCTMHLVDSA